MHVLTNCTEKSSTCTWALQSSYVTGQYREAVSGNIMLSEII